jgi:uncharacterized GH25 family protein
MSHKYNPLNRKHIYIRIVDNDKCVYLNNIIVKRFNIITDDFAYTNSTEFAREIRNTDIEKLHDMYPECFI